MRTIEVERKFRVNIDFHSSPALTALDRMAAWDLWQGYLTVPGAPVEVRIRRVRETASDERPSAVEDPPQPTTRHLLTLKRDVATARAGGVSRTEVETLVDEAFFTEAWRAAEGRRLRKARVEYFADFASGGRRVVVVDTFKDHLEGLILAELEFSDWQSSRDFVAPEWLGTEVTHDALYRNAHLAMADGPPR